MSVYSLRDIPEDLRRFFVRAEIGLEASPDEFVAQLVDVFREVRRVLRDDGTLWVNMGDSYAGSGRGGNPTADSSTLGGSQSSQEASMVKRNRVDVSDSRRVNCPPPRGSRLPAGLHESQRQAGAIGRAWVAAPAGFKQKDLMGMPWRLAFALQADGWVLRQEIIWAKPNPMPESVTDRCTKSHEQLFLFSKAGWTGPQPGRFAHISDEDARWLALLIDAEGCIVVKRNQHDGRADTFAPQVSIGNTSEPLMREVVRIVGHGNLLERPGKNCRMLYWQVANGLARDLLHRLYPFFIVKQRQARICIHVDSLTYARGGKTPERKQRDQATTDRLMSLWSRNKECNSFGQPDLSDVPAPEIGRWTAGPRYYFDAEAISEPVARSTVARLNQDVAGQEGSHRVPGKTNGPMKAKPPRFGGDKYGDDTSEQHRAKSGNDYDLGDGKRNKRSVWTVATQPFSDAHFATFPPALIEPCVLAGSRPGDLVLDPFGGAGTTGLVADRHGRDAVLCELNPDYAAMARRRIFNDAPLFAEVE